MKGAYQKRSPASFVFKGNSAKRSSKATTIDRAQGPVPREYPKVCVNLQTDVR